MFNQTLTRLALFLCLLTSQKVFSQVDLPSGAVDVSFPLFSYNDANRLSVNIALNYKSGNGILVNEMASSVGLGWEINLGGVIARQVLGDPDDQSRLNVPGTNSVFDGYLYSEFNPIRPVHPAMGFTVLSTDVNPILFTKEQKEDRQQDMFYFNINGKTGSFTIAKDGSIQTHLNSRFTITKTELDMTGNNIVTRINQFIMTDEAGIQYKFRDLSTSRLYKFMLSGTTNAATDVEPTQYTYFGYQAQQLTDISIVTSWHLTEIVNPFNGKKITFTYENSNQDYIEGYYPMKYVKTVDNITDYVIQVTKNNVKGTVKILKSIAFPENVSVELLYNPTERIDFPSTHSLHKLAVKKGATEMYAYNFSYKYFSKGDLRAENYAFPEAEKIYARLCLSSFYKSGRNNEQEAPYVFTYAKGPNNTNFKLDWVPRRGAHSKDFWGYYNANPENDINESTEWTIAGSHYSNYSRQFSAWMKYPYNSPRRSGGLQTISLLHKTVCSRPLPHRMVGNSNIFMSRIQH